MFKCTCVHVSVHPDTSKRNLKTLHSQSQLEWHELQVVVQPLQRTLAG